MPSPAAGAGIVIDARIKELHETIQTLNKTIEDYTESSSKQATTMIRLTWAIAILTVLLFFGLLVQIWLAL